MKIYVKTDFNAGYLNVTDGNSYCHEVFRRFSTLKRTELYIEKDIQVLYGAVDFPKEEIDKILSSGKDIINIFRDIYDGLNTNEEWWESCDYYGATRHDWKTKDGNWYESKLYKNNPLWKYL